MATITKEMSDNGAISAYGTARSTVKGAPLSSEELDKIDAYWRASLYLCVGMLYLKDNPLLREPLKLEQTKARLLGHWGSDAGQAFTYIHFNRLINKYDLNAIYISGPGHGAPAVLSQAYLEGTYSEIYPDKSEDAAGMRRFFKQFSFPGGIGSHATPETPGSIHEELEALFVGYGYTPYFVEGSDPRSMHQAMAATLEQCVLEIRKIQEEARRTGKAFRPRWPMVVLRSPKGWTAPRKVGEHYLEGYWRAHQVPIADIATNAASLKVLEQWMRSYKPEELFDKNGRIIPELKALAPKGHQRMSANPIANGGLLRKPLEMPDFRSAAVEVKKPGATLAGNVPTLGNFLREVMRQNMQNFRVFGPDETESNQLQAIYEVSKKVWLGEYFPEDTDGGQLAPYGRVMEMLSEHTVEGWLEGYILSGRHGLINSYEPFIHVIDSMFNQHAKWLEKCNELPWRAKVSSLNLLITALVWRQDHNGFTHQDPGFLDVVANKSPSVVRIYLPPDANCLLSVGEHCLRSVNYVNVIVADKKVHLQYLDMEAAVEHCTKGLGIWNWASNDQGAEPDVVMASCGDCPTMESLAATALLREHLPDAKVRFVNVLDLFKLVPNAEHPHGLTDRVFEAIFSPDKPVVITFHAYPWLIHRLTYRRPSQHNMHVRGYKEQGNINTPLELAIRNQTDRFSLAIDAIDRMPRIRDKGAHVREALLDQQIACKNHAFEFGVDRPDITNWQWPF